MARDTVDTRQYKQETIGDREELLTVHEVARQLRVDDTTIRRWIKNGVLEAITLPHLHKRQAYRIRQTTLNKLLQPAMHQ